MTTENKLCQADFEQVIRNAPLFSIDLVVLNERNEVLVGKRKNAPAKDSWFVPGGRVFKNETIDQAFGRISMAELGVSLHRSESDCLGLFDHFYDNSFFSETVSTHYINAAHLVCLNETKLNLPCDQHDSYRWIDIKSMEKNSLVHHYSKVFLAGLKQQLSFRNNL